jgi:hypothetical protein
MDIQTQLLAFFVSALAIGLKGWQQKNVTGHHYKHVVITSYVMTLTDITFIGLVARHGWDLAISSGTGAACGMVSAMYLHNHFFGEKDA